MAFVRPRTPARAKHFRGLLRVLAYFSVGVLACSAYSVKNARAEFKQQTLDFGRQMFDLAKATNHEVTTIVFNGQKVHIGNSVSSDSPATVLKRYEEYCKSNTAVLNEQPSAATMPKLDEKPSGVVTTGGDDEGTIACFVKGEKTKGDTADAIEAFVTTGELGAIGELRYAWAKKSPSGRTLVLVAWTDSKFNFNEMTGEKDGGDVPGSDFPEIPRLAGTQRVISAYAEGTPYGVNVYRAKQTAAESISFYDRELQAAGWFMYDPEMNEKEHGGVGHAYMKKGVVVTVATKVEDDGTYVAVGLAGVSADDEKLGRN